VTICQHAAAARADFATLVLPRRNDEVVVAAVAGTLAAAPVGHRAPAHSSLSGHAIRTGTASLVSGYGSEAAGITAPLHVGPLIIVPLAAGDHIRGALTLVASPRQHRSPRPT